MPQTLQHSRLMDDTLRAGRVPCAHFDSNKVLLRTIAGCVHGAKATGAEKHLELEPLDMFFQP